jgi:hypothetical protein
MMRELWRSLGALRELVAKTREGSSRIDPGPLTVTNLLRFASRLQRQGTSADQRKGISIMNETIDSPADNISSSWKKNLKDKMFVLALVAFSNIQPADIWN